MNLIQARWGIAFVLIAAVARGADALESLEPEQVSQKAEIDQRTPGDIKFKPPRSLKKSKLLAGGNDSPLYADVDDILDGQHTTLEYDDLMGLFSDSQEPLGRVENVYWYSSNSTLVKNGDWTLSINDQRSKVRHPTAGRMFNLSYDTLAVMLELLDTERLTLALLDWQFGIRYQNLPNFFQDHGYHSALQSADFNGDGFKDLALRMGRNGVVTTPEGKMGPLAIGLSNPSGGTVTWVSSYDLQSWDSVSMGHPGATAEMAVGDFNDDGIPDIASLAPRQNGKGLRLLVNLGPVNTF